MGVGKTCTAITIAEALKSIVTNSKTKIYVIRPDEIVRQLFDINVVSNGNPNYQCTGDTYLKNPNLREYQKIFTYQMSCCHMIDCLLCFYRHCQMN
jgi:hypothetical protein